MAIPYFEITHFSLGPVKFYTWGLLVGLGFAAGYLLLLYQAKKNDISLNKIVGLALTIFLGAALGGRLFFLLQAPARFLADLTLFWHFSQGGLMIYGGIIGGLAAGWLFIKSVKMNFWQIADLAAPALALGIAIGRVGCFLINDHAGAATSLPWGILWSDGIMRHPVALYEILAMAGVFTLLWSLRESISRQRQRDGSIFLLFLFSYAVIRFFLDFLREEQGALADPRVWIFSTSQWISIFLMIFAFIIWAVKKPRLSNRYSPDH